MCIRDRLWTTTKEQDSKTQASGIAVSYTHLDVYKRQEQDSETQASELWTTTKEQDSETQASESVSYTHLY